MSFDFQTIVDPVVSHAMALGQFDRVNAHEPKSAPGSGLTCAVWADWIGPYARRSGLAATSALVRVFVRVYAGALSEPRDAIDPRVVNAVSALYEAYSGDFNLGGVDGDIDLMNMSAQAGYIDIDAKKLRCMTIVMPVVVNDVWVQSP